MNNKYVRQIDIEDLTNISMSENNMIHNENKLCVDMVYDFLKVLSNNCKKYYLKLSKNPVCIVFLCFYFLLIILNFYFGMLNNDCTHHKNKHINMNLHAYLLFCAILSLLYIPIILIFRSNYCTKILYLRLIYGIVFLTPLILMDQICTIIGCIILFSDNFMLLNCSVETYSYVLFLTLLRILSFGHNVFLFYVDFTN